MNILGACQEHEGDPLMSDGLRACRCERSVDRPVAERGPHPARFRWTAALVELLGQMPDEDVALRARVSS